MPKRKEVRWFTRGEFTTNAIAHEGEEDSINIPLLEGRKEILLGKGSSVYTFTNSFAGLSRELERDKSKHDYVTVDGGPHTLWWPTQSPDGSFLPQDIPPAQILREMQPKAKFLITLSDPVKRMYSDYYFLEDNLRPVHPGSASSKSAQQFHDRVKQQIGEFQLCVDAYLDILKLQYKADRSATPPTLEIDLDDKYKAHLPLWFRASQM